MPFDEAQVLRDSAAVGVQAIYVWHFLKKARVRVFPLGCDPRRRKRTA